jgi:hypothetical protein
MSATIPDPSSSARKGRSLASGRLKPIGRKRRSRSPVIIASCHERHFRIRGCARYSGSSIIDLKIGVRWIGTEWQYFI